MAGFSNMDDYELAYTLAQWQGDALLAWDRFSEAEKTHFRLLQDEACRRFIEKHLEQTES